MENSSYSVALKQFLICCIIFSATGWAQGYGAYLNNIADDPVANFYTHIRLLMKEGNWAEMEVKLKQEKIKKQLDDLNSLTKNNLESRFIQAFQSKEEQTVQSLLFEFYAETIQEKFYWSLKESLKETDASTVRLTIAKIFFTQILAPRIMESDRQSQKTEHPKNDYETILKLFGECELALGSVGMFGIGAVPPNSEEYKKSALQIVVLLKKYYVFHEITLP